MKPKETLVVSLTVAAALAVAASVSHAQETAKAGQIAQALRNVPAPEMPARAAALIKQSQAKEMATVTRDVVRAAVKLNPAAAAVVVGSIAKEAPEMAPVAAGTAAGLQPKLAVSIAHAAAAAAPAQAAGIVKAICKEVPKDYRAVAVAVAQIVPSAGKEILQAVADAVPSLRPYLENVQVSSATGAIVPVATILKEAESASQTPIVANGPTIKPPPQITPPFTPLGGTPAEITPGQNNEVPPGGRNYAAP